MDVSAAGAPAPLLAGPTGARPAPEGDFGTLLRQALAALAQLEARADAAAQALAAGQPVDLHDAVLAAEQARLAMDLAVQLRNRALDAYQEIMRLQV